MDSEDNELINNLNEIFEQLQDEEKSDPSMARIRQISNDTFNRASSVIFGKDVEKYDFKKTSEELDELSNSVTDKNKREAKRLISETLLDMMLVNDPESKVTSFRIGHIVEGARQEAEKEKERLSRIPEKYLPIGTVVMLKDATKRLMISGFCMFENGDEENEWDYSGYLYPEGNVEEGKNYLFNHNQIEQIYHMGLIDEEETNFKNALNQALSETQNLI